MEKQEYYLMHKLQNKHWWFLGKKKIFLYFWNRYVGQTTNKNIRILDIGCGDGSYINSINQQGFKNTTGIDFAPEAINFCLQDHLKNIKMVDIENGLGFIKDQSYEVVLMLDSLEHIENDQLTLSEVNRVLKPGGLCFINVPAYPFLWSYHDKYLHHKRRYLKSQLTQKACRQGLGIKKITYTNIFILPIVVVIRIIKRLTNSHASDTIKTNPFLNSFLKSLYGAEIALLKLSSLPAGLSLFAILQKPLVHTQKISNKTKKTVFLMM